MPVKEYWSAVGTSTGYVILQLASYTKILRIPKAKSTTNQFILSEEASKVATYECQNQKTNSELSRGGL